MMTSLAPYSRIRPLHSRRVQRLAIAMLLIGLLVVLLTGLFRYQPALSAAPGYTMQLVTAPDLFGGFIKTIQTGLEQRSCQYMIVGWSKDDALYYQATCNSQTQFWRFAPQSGASGQVADLPDRISYGSIPASEVLKMVRADGISPERYESVTRPLLLKSSGYVSDDGHWTAIITQHVYGPQDIVVLAPARSANRSKLTSTQRILSPSRAEVGWAAKAVG